MLSFYYLVMKSNYVKLNEFFVELVIKFLSSFLRGTKIYKASMLTNALSMEWIAVLRAKAHRAVLWPLLNTLESFINCFPMKHSGHLNAVHFFDDRLVLINCSMQLSVRTFTSISLLCFINCGIRKLAAFNETISAWK